MTDEEILVSDAPDTVYQRNRELLIEVEALKARVEKLERVLEQEVCLVCTAIPWEEIFAPDHSPFERIKELEARWARAERELAYWRKRALKGDSDE